MELCSEADLVELRSEADLQFIVVRIISHFWLCSYDLGFLFLLIVSSFI